MKLLNKLAGYVILPWCISVYADDGPGLGNLTYTDDELFTSISHISEYYGHGRVAMVNGYLMVLYSSDGGGNYNDGGITFWDVSNPKLPELKYRYDNEDTHWLKEPHGFVLSNSYTVNGQQRDLLMMTAMKGAQIWDVTDPSNVFLAKNIQIEEITKSGYLGSWSLAWQPPYLYIGATDLGVIVVRVDDDLEYEHITTVPPTQLGDANIGMPHAVGNLLIGTPPQSGKIATIDIANPESPLLVDIYNTASSYSSNFAAGYLFGSDLNSTGKVTVHRVGHDGIIAEKFTTSNLIKNRGGYGTYQDGYYFEGVSSAAVKYDLSNGAVLGKMTSGLSGRDEDFAEVLGNLVFAGNDHHYGTGIFVHDTQPDTKPPKVEWMHPAPGSVSLPLTSRIGVSMSDSVDFSSVDSSSFSVISEGSSVPVAGKYSVKGTVVNFTPNEPLQANTRYTVVIEGVKDYVGNESPHFETVLTTGEGGELNHIGPIWDVLSPSSADGSHVISDGQKVYVDREYVFAGVPDFLNGASLVRTANNDKRNSSDSYLTLSMNRATDFYVVFDARARTLPAWLDSTYTKLPNGVSYGSGTQFWNFDIYHKEFGSGNLTLGGVLNGGGSGVGSNYVVAAKPRSVDTELPRCLIGDLDPVEVGASAAFSGNVSHAQGVEYSWSFGDGTQTEMSANLASSSHIYQESGRYPVILRVRNDAGLTNCSAIQIVYGALTVNEPVQSTAIIEAKLNTSASGSVIVKANPDNNSVTAISPVTGATLWEVGVGEKPVSVSQSPGGELWVLNRLSATISRLNVSDGSLISDIVLPQASLPAALTFVPGKNVALASLQGTGELLKLNVDGTVAARETVIKDARAIAVDASGEYAYISQFISDDDAGRVAKVRVDDFTDVDVIKLAFDQTLDTEASGRGVPNYLSSLAINPQGTELIVSSLKANIARGQFRDGKLLDFQNTIRSIVSVIDLESGQENLSRRFDFDNRELPSFVKYSPLGDVYFVSFQGNNVVEARDSKTHSLISSVDTQAAPQGLAISGNRLYTHNFLGRSSTSIDVAGLLVGQSNVMHLLQHTPTVSTEQLSTPVLEGKKLFYSSDLRMALDGYVACASCHIEGRDDGRVWDMTQIGEGFRNTPSLLGKGGMRHGLVHWTANFDEIQDFENQIREVFLGTGLMTDEDYAISREPLGTEKKAGRSEDLDNLAAYVASLSEAPESPYRIDGSLTLEASIGGSLFNTRGCVDCHSGVDFRDGEKHDVGTIKPSSGLGIGVPLENVGFDTPTLLGVWNTAPYFHDGSAATLQDTLTESHTGQSFTAQEKQQLTAYLKQIELADDPELLITDLEDEFAVNSHRSYRWVISSATGQKVYTDRGYIWSTLPDFLTGVPYLLTANDDKRESKSDYISFDVETDVTVWVAFDARKTNLPDWLRGTGWVKHSSDQLHFSGYFYDLYKKPLGEGVRVTLGGAESNANYGVFVTKR